MDKELEELKGYMNQILVKARAAVDKTVLDAVIANLGHPDDVVIYSALSMVHIDFNQGFPTPGDLLQVGDFLDTLDAFGYEVRKKDA